MTKASGVILRVHTRHGHAEAECLGHTETGQRRWRIKGLSVTKTFEGTPEQAVALMKERLAQQTKGEAERTCPPTLSAVSVVSVNGSGQPIDLTLAIPAGVRFNHTRRGG